MNSSYSYDGADLILKSLLRTVSNGFYIDIGANHPKNYSNTYLLYTSGWCGIGVDGNEKFKDMWKLERPKDTYIHALLSDTQKLVDFTVFAEDTLSSIDANTAERYISRLDNGSYRTERSRTITLQSLFDEYIKQREVHLLSIDVEGEDFKVLKGLNLEQYRPGCIVIEIKNYSLSDIYSNEIVRYLKNNNYYLVAKTPLDSFFICEEKEYFKWIPKPLIHP